VTFHLIKSSQFRSLRVDGAVGSITPGGISLTFFVERGAIPRAITHEVLTDGSLGELVSAEGKTGIVRELQTSLVLDFASARSLMEQLGKMLKNVEPNEDAKTDEGD
jgi:hypothetical protein